MKIRILIFAGLAAFLTLPSLYARGVFFNNASTGDGERHRSERKKYNSNYGEHFVRDFPADQKPMRGNAGERRHSDRDRRGDRHADRERHHDRRNFPFRERRRPVVIVDRSPVIVEREVVYVAETDTGDGIPYGFLNDDGMIESPWSDFTISAWRKEAGQILTDPNTGQLFRVP
ncbi:MAG: hypothetical protein V1746_05250 [bacterium]